jgi:hypothetical protein
LSSVAALLADEEDAQCPAVTVLLEQLALVAAELAQHAVHRGEGVDRGDGVAQLTWMRQTNRKTYVD